MEQRLRLVQGGQGRFEKRAAERRRIEVPGQIVWKDARGTTRMASVVTRDVSEHGVCVECLSGTPIPQYRLVYFQVDREARHRADLPSALRKSSVLSAVFRVGECRQSTGAPSDYALLLRRLQQRKCAETGGRLWKTSEVDHRVPLFRVWREHREMDWPSLLGFWGLPNLQVINRDAHTAKCAVEATTRRRTPEVIDAI